MTTLRARLAKGDSVLGTFIFSSDPSTTQAAGAAGLDFVIVDTEHTALSVGDVLAHVRAAPPGLGVLARVAEGEVSQATRMLDAGVEGIVIPHVRSVDQVQRFVEQLRYHPQGVRGECSVTPATGLGVAGLGAAQRDSVNHRTLVVGLIEDVEALDQVSELVASGLLDVVMLGPRDLAASFERAGSSQSAEEAFAGATSRLDQAVRMSPEVAIGAFVPTLDELRKAGDRSARFLVYRIDLQIVAQAYLEGVTAMSEGGGS